MGLTSDNIVFMQRAGWRRPLVRQRHFEGVESGGQPCKAKWRSHPATPSP
jgi:hypothetical protein